MLDRMSEGQYRAALFQGVCPDGIGTVARLAARSLPALGRVHAARVLALPPAATVAAAVPLLFLHARYQPTLSVPFGGTSVDVTLADLAVAAVACAAVLVAQREGTEPLRRARNPLLAAGLLVLLVLLAVSYPRLRGEPYDLPRHLVSALKFGWYALLAPAVPLLVRRRSDGLLLGRALVLWSGAATAWGFLQFLGLVNEFEGKRPGQREPSFVGIHDFAALSGAALAIGVVGIALGPERVLGRRWTTGAAVAGALGLVLSGAMTAVAGLWLAAAAVVALGWKARTIRRGPALAILATVLAVSAGTTAMRASTIERFAEFVGLREKTADTGVESYAHRTLLAYIGWKVFLDHPVAGSGWQGSSEAWAYAPHLEQAHTRFPNEPDEAFPSTEHPWGVQNLYVETLADLGVIGFAGLALLFGLAVAAGLRGSRSTPLALVGLAWLLLAAGIWAGLGLVPGIPLAALTWLAVGLVTVRA
jgi:O-antigen ligase